MEEPVLENGLPAEPAEAVAEPAEPTEAAEPAAAPWAVGPEEWQQLTGTVQQLAEQFRPVPVETAPPGVTDYFPVDPTTGEASLTLEGLERMVNDRIEAGVQQRIGQFEPVLNQTVADRGEQMIAQKFETLAKPATEGGAGLGEFDHTLARELAEGYAASGFDANAAIERGAQRAREFAQSQRQAGADEYKTTLQNIGSAPREPGVNGAGVASEELLPVGHPDRYKQITDNWVARNKLG